eukprot:m.46562 g.46562  ORF g.46562 m.46562 type:complete len:66 (-) comp7276_c0_seq1:2456-2653(-)
MSTLNVPSQAKSRKLLFLMGGGCFMNKYIRLYFECFLNSFPFLPPPPFFRSIFVKMLELGGARLR